MLSLSDMQDKFQRHLLHGDTDIIELIAPDQTTTVEQRLATYKNAYIARLIEALSSDFSCLRTLLGEDLFNTLCCDYIDQHPSTSASLRWFGDRFPEYVKQHSCSQNQTRLYDLAVMEWMFISAFDAPEQQTLNAMTMMDIPMSAWPTIKLTFHPSVFYFKSHWNTVMTWQALKNKHIAPDPDSTESHACLIWRQALVTRYRVLDADEAALIEQAMQGSTFEQLCDTQTLLPESQDMEPEQIAMRSATLLKLWLDEGLICKIT